MKNKLYIAKNNIDAVDCILDKGTVLEELGFWEHNLDVYEFRVKSGPEAGRIVMGMVEATERDLEELPVGHLAYYLF